MFKPSLLILLLILYKLTTDKTLIHFLRKLIKFEFLVFVSLIKHKWLE